MSLGLLAALAGCGGQAAPASSPSTQSAAAPPPSAAAKPPASAAISAAPASGTLAKPAASVAPVSATGPASAKPASVTKINYGQITISALNWPFFIAEQQGYLKELGIDLSTVIGGNTAATSQAIVSGGTDIAQMNLVQQLAANMAGADLIVVAGDTMVPIYTLIVDPSTKSYAQLKGKRLAVAGPTDPLNFVLQKMLAANGLQPNDYEMVPVGGSPDRLSAVKKGATAGSLLSQPDDFRALADGMGQLGRSTDYVDHFQYTVTGVRRQWAQQHKDVLVNFLRAYVRACQFFYDPKNKDAAIKSLVVATKADQKAAEDTYNLYVQSKKTLPQKGELDLDGSKVVVQNWKDFGLQKEPPAIEKAIDLSYLQEAQKLEGVADH
jgi:NitT/TauT family transport system substrate-binding protein